MPRKPEEVSQIINVIRGKLLGRYPRVSRPLRMEEMPENEIGFYPDFPGCRPFKLHSPPMKGYSEVSRLRLNEIFATSELLGCKTGELVP